MRAFNLSLLFVLLISSTYSKEDGTNTANVDNLKILRTSVNFAYKAGNDFLNLVRGSTPPNQSFTQMVKIARNRESVRKLSDFIPIVLPYVGYLSLLMLGLLFFIFVPIVGFCFCLCRCAGKCGGKIKGMDPKHATCKRYVYALFLGVISIIQLAGIVLAFINNQLIHDTLTHSNGDISAVKQFSWGIQDMQSSMTNISEAIRNAESSPKINVDFEANKADFEEVTCTGFFSLLEKNANRLNIKENLKKILSALKEADNEQATYGSDKLTKYSYKLKTAMSNLKFAFVRPKVCTILSSANEKDFEELRGMIGGQSNVGQSTGTKLKEIVSIFNDYILKGLSQVNKQIENIKIEHLEYRLYAGIGVCCLLLLIVLFYFLGLCFGQCGERPFEDARLCNRGVGANLMMAGVAFAFLFTPTIMLIEMVLFMVGGTWQTETCRYATNSFEPGVHVIDSIVKFHKEIHGVTFNHNLLDSIINKCPTEPMAFAFNLTNNSMSQEISLKIEKMVENVKALSPNLKKSIVDLYFKDVEILLKNISAEVNTITSDPFSRLASVTSTISALSLTSLKTNIINGFTNAASVGFAPALKKEALRVSAAASLSSYSNVRCNELSASAVKIIDSICVTFLWPFNGFWFGVGICLVFTIPGIIFAVKLAGLYRRTEKYSADFEEPDYHSYMGFYTNNADNIPMKRPKSANSNHKNRNSNSNNKASLKQNNPQYLPVYPYDAYE